MKLKLWWWKQKHSGALYRVIDLEKSRKWIDRFFLGETGSKIELEKWEKKMQKAQEDLKIASSMITKYS
jgi:hypothetical protein